MGFRWLDTSTEQPFDALVHRLLPQGLGHELERRRRDGFAGICIAHRGVAQARRFGEVRGGPAANRGLVSQDLGVDAGAHCRPPPATRRSPLPSPTTERKTAESWLLHRRPVPTNLSNAAVTIRRPGGLTATRVRSGMVAALVRARMENPAVVATTARLRRRAIWGSDSSVRAWVPSSYRRRQTLHRLDAECRIRAGATSVNVKPVATRLVQAMR
jgi:hypothetical protein